MSNIYLQNIIVIIHYRVGDYLSLRLIFDGVIGIHSLRFLSYEKNVYFFPVLSITQTNINQEQILQV